MKKVLVLNQFALPRDQGGGTRHADLFSRLSGWKPTIVAGNRNHYSQQVFETADQSFRLVKVPEQDGGARQRLYSWLSYCRQASILGLRTRPDVVYASSPHLLAPLTGWMLARATRKPYVLEVRDLWPESFVAAGLLREHSSVHKALMLLEKFLVRRADEIVVVTGGWESHFRALGADMARYTVVPNGTEPYDLHMSAAERETLRSQLGIHGVTAVFAGAHGPKDGIDLILDAATKCPEINFLLLGSGPVKKAAQERATSDGLTNVVFRDPVAKDELPRILAACDIGIHAVSPLPVFKLGMSPNKLFDYMAAGLPIVSNAGESVRALVGDGAVGYVGESDALVDSLRAITRASSQERRDFAARGKSLISDRFSRARAAEILGSVLDRATQSPSRKDAR